MSGGAFKKDVAMKLPIHALVLASLTFSPALGGALKDACISKGQSAQHCTCYEREAMAVASPPVIEYMAVQLRTGEPPIGLMLNSGMDVSVFGDQIKALADRTNAVCFGQ